MDYSIYRFEAVVDFIELEIHTAKQYKGGTIKKRCDLFNLSYFTPVQANAGGWANVFRTRLYDLKSFAALQSKIASLESEVPFSRPPTVTCIEVAFDGYLKDDMQNAADASEALAELAARMVYRMANPVSENRRIYRDYKGSPEALPRHIGTLERKMGDGLNAAIGNKNDDEYQHGYVKTTDYNKRQLLAALHRARFEIRLAGAGLPNSDVGTWAGFKFESLSRYISFRREDDTASPLEQAIVSAYAGRASHKKSIKRREGGGIRHHITPADNELNRIVRQRLQTLSKRWKTAPAGRKKVQENAIIAT